MSFSSFQAHLTAVIDSPCSIGEGTRIWHFVHICEKAEIGKYCIFGQNAYVGPGVKIGNNVKVQNNVAIYAGVELEDDVFCGPSCVFTNVTNPRSQIVRRHQLKKTLVRRGATIGANATILCGVTLGQYAFVAAGAVVTHSVQDYALMMGVPGWQAGWMSRHGQRMLEPASDGTFICAESGWRYREMSPGVLRCLDWPEDQPLPEHTPSHTSGD